MLQQTVKTRAFEQRKKRARILRRVHHSAVSSMERYRGAQVLDT